MVQELTQQTYTEFPPLPQSCGKMASCDSVMMMMMMLVAVAALISDSVLVTAAAEPVPPQTSNSKNLSETRRLLRQRRAQAMTQKEIDEVVNHHNSLRGKEGASNMELMTWKDSLAQSAMNWSENCVWEHPSKLEHPQYEGLGQNLYYASGSFPIDLTHSIQMWYDEKTDYTFETMHCPSDKMCGHYTQVVWATTIHVGCAYAQCTPLKAAGGSQTQASEAMFLTCDYHPGGNMVGQHPYRKGAACSQCTSGMGWCTKDKLCNNACEKVGDDCPWSTCAAQCYNCATLDKTTCSCHCAAGWHGPDCRTRCDDHNAKCGANPGWPKSWCENSEHSYVKTQCPALCSACERDNDAKEDACEPLKGPAAHDDPTSSASTINSQIVKSLTSVTALITSFISPAQLLLHL